MFIDIEIKTAYIKGDDMANKLNSRYDELIYVYLFSPESLEYV